MFLYKWTLTLKLKRVHNRPNKTLNFKIKTAGVLVVQIQSVCFNISPKTAAACVVSRRRPDTNRKLQQELHGILQTHRHRNDKPPFYASLVVALYISVKMLYRAVFHLKKNKKTTVTEDWREIQRRRILSSHRQMSCD